MAVDPSSNRSVDDVVRSLGEHFGDRITVNASVREHHARDESWFPPAPPDAVFFPHTVDEVSLALRTCNECGVPVIPYGSGTGVAGQINAIRGGLCIDLSEMNRVLEVNADDLDCRVEAGVTRGQLNEYIRDTGLFFPVDPGADASLGGMAATRASGTTTVRYGTMRENVLGLTAVLASGEVVRTGRRARKSAAGYDLTHLLVGSEGTLGIIVDLTLRLHGRAEASATAIVQFQTLADAVDTVIAAMQVGLPLAAIELVDATLLEAMSRHSGLNLAAQPSLFVSFHGTSGSINESSQMFLELCAELECTNSEWIVDEEQQNAIWKARHNAAWAFLALRPNSRNMSTDVCVPVSALASCIEETSRDLAENVSVVSTIAGHVGDGNFHVVFLVDPEQPEEKVQIDAFYGRLVERALRMEGTCSGEHGIGLQKKQFMEAEFGTSGLRVMWAIKSALDPKHIMNPGKKLPQC